MADEKLLDKVQGLINKANGTDNEHERDAFLSHADLLMRKHKIDEAILRARAGNAGARQQLNLPVHDKFEWVPRHDEFWNAHADVVGSLAVLCEVKLVFTGESLSVFGMAPDVAYFRMLWTSAYLTFSARLFPKWSKTLTTGENIKMLAESGMKWVPMWQEARANGDLMDVACPPKDNGKMKRLYAKACKDVGEEKMKLTHAAQTYRDSYALAFSETISTRALRLRAQRDGLSVGGAELVLKSDADAIENLLRETYPHLTYGGRTGRSLRGGVGAGSSRGAAAGNSVDFSSGGVGGGAAPAGALGTAPKAIR